VKANVRKVRLRLWIQEGKEASEERSEEDGGKEEALSFFAA